VWWRRRGGELADEAVQAEGRTGCRQGEREGRTWDGGHHDLAERNADAVEAVDDGGELEVVETRGDVANHRDALAWRGREGGREGGRERRYEIVDHKTGAGRKEEGGRNNWCVSYRFQ